LGFQYGYGFFETIRVDKGNIGHINAHIDRFNHTWEHLFAGEPPDLTWNEIINQVISQNRLLNETAAVKIIASRGDRESPPFNHTLLVTARLYTHRLAEKKVKGLNLAVYPHPRQTPLADYKTLNYLYYFLSGKWATTQNADEALILNPDNTVSETNTANILLVKDHTITKPVSSHVLPGIMDTVVCKFLSGRGFTIESKKVFLEDLFSFDEIMITNSLIGAVPVLSIDGKKLPEPSDLWKKINKTVLYPS
jgi:para-aminobenzoate synthetase component 1